MGGVPCLAEDTERNGSFVAALIEAGASVLKYALELFSNYWNDRRNLEEEKNYETHNIGGMILMLGIGTTIALVVSTLARSVLISHAKFLVNFALLFDIAATAVFAIGFLFLSPFAAIMGVGMFALTCYAYVVWGRIPFLACNLETTAAVKSDLGLASYAYGSFFLATGWLAWWMVSLVSILYITGGRDWGSCEKEPSRLLVSVLLLSCYWTFQIILNVVHVTVVGTMGTWWFVLTEGLSFCSRDLVL